jgi:hypothetical protein
LKRRILTLRDLGAMEVCSSTEMGAPGASHLGTGDNGPKTDRSTPRSVPVNALVAILRAGPPGFPAKRNHACSRLVLRLARRNGSVRCGRVCSKIVYSVRIGPSQLKSSSLSIISANPATIRICTDAMEIRETLPSKNSTCLVCHNGLNVIDSFRFAVVQNASFLSPWACSITCRSKRERNSGGTKL